MNKLINLTLEKLNVVLLLPKANKNHFILTVRSNLKPHGIWTTLVGDTMATVVCIASFGANRDASKKMNIFKLCCYWNGTCFFSRHSFSLYCVRATCADLFMLCTRWYAMIFFSRFVYVTHSHVVYHSASKLNVCFVVCSVYISMFQLL